MNGRSESSDYYQQPSPDAFAPGSGHEVLEIGIIGAGVAGLSAAIALARSGHNVEVFEKSRFNNEIGAAINACPNASRILKYWNFDFEQAGATTIDALKFMNGKTMDMMHHVHYSDVEAKYAAPWYCLHRVDLHNELKRLATEQTRVKIHLSCAVDGADTFGKLMLQNGRSVQKDLVVVADGIRSRFTRLVAGKPVVNEPCGTAVYRFVIPAEKLMADPVTRPMYEDATNTMFLAFHNENKFVCYSCRRGTLYNLALFKRDDIEGYEGEVWNIPASLEELNRTAVNLHPTFRAVCAKAENITQWRMVLRSEMNENLVRGKIAVIGDAQHPMLPFQGQAAAMGIEDAAALGVFFSSFTSKDQLEDRLALFQDFRKDRVCAMQILSKSGQEGATYDEASKYIKGPLPKLPHEHHAYNFAPDLYHNATAVLKKHLAEKV